MGIGNWLDFEWATCDISRAFLSLFYLCNQRKRRRRRNRGNEFSRCQKLPRRTCCRLEEKVKERESNTIIADSLPI